MKRSNPIFELLLFIPFFSLACAPSGQWINNEILRLPKKAVKLDDQATSTIINVILEAVPKGWKLVETIKGQIPYGHHCFDKYEGPRGCKIVIQGTEDVYLAWSDEKMEPLAKEALVLWIMPPEYHDSWKTCLIIDPQIPPPLIYSGKNCRIYGDQGRWIISKIRFEEIYKEIEENPKGKYLLWSDSPIVKNSPYKFSWTTWRKDLKRHLQQTLITK